MEAGIDLQHCDLDGIIAARDYVALLRALPGATVVLNSNDLFTPAKLELVKKLYVSCPDTLFVGWVWDNHHMIAHSAIIGSTVDVLYVAHSDNMQILNRFCPFVRPPLPAAIMNWTKREAAAFGAQLSCERPVRLSGSFLHYPKFHHRNRIVERLMTQGDGAALRMLDTSGGTAAYVAKSASDKWQEWTSSKVNLVVPTLSDLPIRIFDALLTGNVPLLPRTIAHVFSPAEHRALADMPVLWFDYADLPDIVDLVAIACARFDGEGMLGVLRRHRYALDTHLIEDRLQTMVADLRTLGTPFSA